MRNISLQFFSGLPILRRRFRIAATGDAGSGTIGNPSSLLRLEETASTHHVRIGRPSAMLLTVFFIGLMVTPSVQELVDYSNSSLRGSFEKDAARFGVQIALQEVERHVIYDSKFANTVRRPYQTLLVSHLGQGSTNVLVGQHGFLFHRGDVESSARTGILSKDFMEPPEVGWDVVEDFVNRTMRRVRKRDANQALANVAIPHVRGFDQRALRLSFSSEQLRSPSPHRRRARESNDLSGMALARVSGVGRPGVKRRFRKLEGSAHRARRGSC